MSSILQLILWIYVLGVIADLVFQVYAMIIYSFGFEERGIYEANLNKVGLAWDPLYLRVYPLSEFKHSTLRFWGITLMGIVGSVLSWYQVLYRLHRMRKAREISAMLTPEQKQAGFALRNNPSLSEEEVRERLQVLDPSLYLPERGTILIAKEVNSAEFSRLFAKALVDPTGRKVLVPLLEASGNNVTPREIAILKYVVGEEDREFLVRRISEIGKDNPDYREAAILVRQMNALKAVLEGHEDSSSDDISKEG